MAVWRAYFAHARRYPVAFSLLVLGDVGMQAAELASPLVLRSLFNLLSTQPRVEASVPAMVTVIAVFGAVSVAGWAMRRLQTFSLIYIEWNAMSDIFDSAFQYLIRHSYNFFTSNFAGSLTHRITKFARAFEAALDSIMLQFFPTSLFASGVLVVLYLRNPVLALVMMAWMVVFLTFQLIVARARQPLRVARAEADSANTAALADAIGNHATTKRDVERVWEIVQANA